MPTDMPLVVIIIVNWNHSDDTIACLRSLQDITYLNYRTIVVDNGSTDSSVKDIQGAFSDIAIIKNSENLGFARAVNAGIKTAITWNTKYVLLLNNDTVVAPDFLDFLVAYCEHHPDVGLAGTTVYYFGTETHFSSGGWANRFLPLLSKDFTPQDIDLKEPKELDYIWGQAVLIRRSVIEKVGNFDPVFFMYYEDCDFCRRAAAAGFKLLYVPQARIWHKIGFSMVKQEWKRWRYKIRSMLYFYRKYSVWGWPQAVLQTCLTLSGVAIREAIRGNWRWVSYPLGSWKQ
ncbi:MAG: glycosyltransferase family 2 protein [Anaerolineae bacterium]|nr:glycosyltransferase family 2 protein [Anaerolineae bacterium]